MGTTNQQMPNPQKAKKLAEKAKKMAESKGMRSMAMTSYKPKGKK
jgi:hypothetical protein